jgi:ribosomal protein S13
MKSEVTIEAEKRIAEALGKIERIGEAKARTIQDQAGAKERLESLKTELPGLLAARALGQATDSEVSVLKRDIRDLETAVEDAALAMQGLEAMEQPIWNSLRGPRRLLSKANDYEWAKKEIVESHGVGLIPRLKDLAHVLGFESDCESFVQGLPQMRS